MQFTIVHQGVPIGIVELNEPGEYLVVPVATLPAYEVLRTRVRAASIALADVALSSGTSPEAGGALRRGADLGRALELRDHAGSLVPTDFIELTGLAGRRAGGCRDAADSRVTRPHRGEGAAGTGPRFRQWYSCGLTNAEAGAVLASVRFLR